jgi:hypothetical protein
MPLNGIIADDACILCGLAVPELLTWAHRHRRESRPRGVKRKPSFRLCWTCHRAYDIGIVRTDELDAAQKALASGRRQPLGVLWRRWKRDLERGIRRINMRLQHGQTHAQSVKNAKKAVRTMIDRQRRLHLIAMKAVRTRRANAASLR